VNLAMAKDIKQIADDLDAEIPGQVHDTAGAAGAAEVVPAAA
jgi:hypothetical protein